MSNVIWKYRDRNVGTFRKNYGIRKLNVNSLCNFYFTGSAGVHGLTEKRVKRRLRSVLPCEWGYWRHVFFAKDFDLIIPWDWFYLKAFNHYVLGFTTRCHNGTPRGERLVYNIVESCVIEFRRRTLNFYKETLDFVIHNTVQQGYWPSLKTVLNLIFFTKKKLFELCLVSR